VRPRPSLRSRPSLSVFETLLYTARLRLPRTLSLADKLKHVRGVIAELGLESCAQTTIGSTMRRGVSGGELKRVNIANELLSSPAVLVCDEPTSGLDSFIALSVMHALKAYGQKHGVAIVCSIHQPSSQIAQLFDTALLLAPGGREVFLGGVDAIKPYLALDNLMVPSDYTVTDFVMELLASDERADMLVDKWKTARPALAAERALISPRVATSHVVQRPPGAGFAEQTRVLMMRQIRQSRGTLLARTEVLLSVLVGLITGVVWFQTAVPGPNGEPPSERAMLGAIFYFLAHMSWWPMYLYLFR
jgi:energy-coupling factor transporter ATP-binding protein EcfA2